VAVYKYINIQGKYFCLRQNPFVLGWWLFSGKRPLPSFLDKKKMLRLFYYQIVYMIRPERNNNLLELPVRGTYCLPVRGGYKVFDLMRDTVTKIFDSGTDEETVKSEIERLRKVGTHDFAPSILRWDIEEQWYEEEHVSGDTGYTIAPSGSAAFMKIYMNAIAPCIERLIQAKPPLMVNLNEHVQITTDKFNRALPLRKDFDDDIMNYVRNFVQSVVDQISAKRNLNICLVFSHGDFHQFNIFRTDSGVKIIDWEGRENQSILFDLYNYFFSQLYLHNTESDLIAEMQEAVASLHSFLIVKAPETADSIQHFAPLYRQLYYIERISTFVDEFALPPDKLLRWIEVFNQFESNLKFKVEKQNVVSLLTDSPTTSQ
jgi:hypothetical protein